MKASEFITRIKIAVPNIGVPGITDTELLVLLSQAVDEVNLLAKVYKGSTDINIVANQQTYSLGTVAPTYLGPLKIPFKFKDSNNKWQKVYPKTLPWIEGIYPDWLNAGSAAIPRWYWLEGDELGFFNKPSTTKTAGARLYHLKKGTPMTSVDHYPFTGSSTIQLVALRPLDEAIIEWVRWQLAPSMGANTDQDLRERAFEKKCAKGAKQIRRRPDYTGDSAYGGVS